MSEPVDVIVNNCVIARGEVVVVEGNFGIRIKQVISRQERLRTLKPLSMLERYLIPLVPYPLLALGAIVCVLLFASLEKEMRRLKSRLRMQNQGELVSQEELQISLEA